MHNIWSHQRPDERSMLRLGRDSTGLARAASGQRGFPHGQGPHGTVPAGGRVGRNGTSSFGPDCMWFTEANGIVGHGLGQHGHVNNVVYNRYAESARVNWTRNFGNIFDPAHKAEWRELMTPLGVGLILRSIRTDYKFYPADRKRQPLTWPDRVTVLHKLRTEPTPDADHFVLDVVILSELHRRIAARCYEDIVVYDYRAAKKAPLKPFMLEQFKETWRLQQEAQKTYSTKISASCPWHKLPDGLEAKQAKFQAFFYPSSRGLTVDCTMDQWISAICTPVVRVTDIASLSSLFPIRLRQVWRKSSEPRRSFSMQQTGRRETFGIHFASRVLHAWAYIRTLPFSGVSPGIQMNSCWMFCWPFRCCTLYIGQPFVQVAPATASGPRLFSRWSIARIARGSGQGVEEKAKKKISNRQRAGQRWSAWLCWFHGSIIQTGGWVVVVQQQRTAISAEYRYPIQHRPLRLILKPSSGSLLPVWLVLSSSRASPGRQAPPRPPLMVTKTKRNGGNTHDKRHENGLAAPGKRIAKQKSNPQLNGHANGTSPEPTSTPPLPDNVHSHIITHPGVPSDAVHGPVAAANHSTATAVSRASPAREGRDSCGLEGPFDAHDIGRPYDTRPDGSSSDAASLSSPRPFAKSAPYKNNMLTMATTILTSCPLRDVLAILILLLQLPPTVLTLVQFLFASLTFVPPQAGTPLSALSVFPSFTDIFAGSGGSPSIFTIVFADAFILIIWLMLWVPVQSFLLDLAQAVIAIALGGAAAAQTGRTNSIFICFGIIFTKHVFRSRPLRQYVSHLAGSGLFRGGLDFLMSPPPSSSSNFKNFSTTHGWPRSLLGIHILAQGLLRMIRRSLSRRDAAQPLPTGKKTDPEAGVHLPRPSTAQLDPTADVPGSLTGDGRPPGPSPAAQPARDRVSSSRRKRKQAAHVRSQQPFWAALASTKVTVMKEMESNRAANDAGEANAKDANHIGNALWTGEEDRVWISQVGPTDISFRVSMGSEEEPQDEGDVTNGHAVSGIDRSKPFYLRVNGADWSSTRIRPAEEDGETGIWTGEIFGLTALANYFCEFVRTSDNEVFYSTSLITSVGPTDEQVPVASPSAHQTLRPSSPTTTLKNSIAAADQKLQDLRNRLKRNRKDHKAAITAIKKEVETLTNRLANAGGNDERQHQRVRQFNQNIKQADAAAADFALQIDSLGEVPREEMDNAHAKKQAWKQERDHKNAVSADLENCKNEIERQAHNVESDIAAVLQKRERLRQRQTALIEKHDRLITANIEGLSAKQRREQERAALRAERAAIENQYRSSINGFERRANEMQSLTAQLLANIQHLETLLLQEAQQPSTVPSTPEGPLPGTSTVSPAPSIAFSTIPFPSLTAQVNPSTSTPASIRGGRGRSSSMLSNISGFTDGFDDVGSPSSTLVSSAAGFHGPIGFSLNGRKGSHGSGSLSSGTSSQSSSQRDPLSPVPVKKQVAVRGPIGGGGGSGR
ncbi:uncharacterized protein EI97DRAFT_499912 [Westerdykella ornata]|uniref:Ubiquitination network signaling protein n=1 Tax=Westerdykella ornata TaxID=318751 RepID=A0A6A6JQF5_WESOR|nr:uncharacterized protein EI97DRAFT_499912 [Westerdykella ornata]KAF2278495.1 hypothetical protein EI97DRAFT_499912 [Westerdykella ornata]